MSRLTRSRCALRHAPAERFRLRPRLLALEGRDAPAVFTVINLLDGPVVAAGDVPGSLRQAIFDANALAGPDTIGFSGVAGKIALAAGELSVTGAVTISGPGAAALTIDAGGTSRVFDIDPVVVGEKVSISGLTITGGAAPAFGGGGLLNAGADLTLVGCVVSGNSATAGLFSGGGVYNDGGTLTLDRCTVTGNAAGFMGGGVRSFTGTVTVRSSLIAGNTALRGGGIQAMGPCKLTVENSTVSGNAATELTVSGRGGGICMLGFATPGASFTMRNSTVTANSAAGFSGGGIHLTGTSTNPVVIESSIVSGNAHPFNPDPAYKLSPDFYGPSLAAGSPAPVVTVNKSLIGVGNAFALPTAGAGNLIGTELAPLAAKLGPLAANGGPTLTHALLAGSPAINAGSNLIGTSYDQRGAIFNRSSGVEADMGAFEVQVGPPPEFLLSLINGGAVQRSMVNNVKIGFSMPVLFPGGVTSAFTLTRTGPGGPVGTVALAIVAGPAVVDISFIAGGAVAVDKGGSVPDGHYTLTINAAKVLGFGGTLDGNYDGGSQGSPYDDVTISFHRLLGDSEGDGDVDAFDLIAFRAVFGAVGPGTTAFDADGDGDVDAADFARFRGQFGLAI